MHNKVEFFPFGITLRKLLIIAFMWAGVLTGQSYRGLSVVNDRVAWISGSKGHVLRTLDGGKSFDTVSPAGYAGKDFRDVHAWSRRKAIVMSAGDSAVFLLTSDGGKNWVKVYENNRPGIFFDAFDIFGAEGAAVSDPVSFPSGDTMSRGFVLVFTHNWGRSWGYTRDKAFLPLPSANLTEAAFAASGSVIHVIDSRKTPIDRRTYIVTGGTQPRMLRIDMGYDYSLPIRAGEGCGAYSMYLDENRNGIIVGGKWNEPGKWDSTGIYSEDGGISWKLCTSMPSGYRSSVCGRPGRMVWVCTGSNGTDMSRDYGKNWSRTLLEGYNVSTFSKRYLWLAGKTSKGNATEIKRVSIKWLVAHYNNMPGH